MGFFSNVRELKKMGKEISRDFDPAAQMRAASAQMTQMTQQANLSTSATAVTSPASVVGLRETGTMVDLQTVVDVDVIVMPAGDAPFPAVVRVMGMAQLVGVSPGATIHVRYEPANPSIVALA